MLSRYFDHCGFDNSTNFKIFDVIIYITAHLKLYFPLFRWNSVICSDIGVCYAKYFQFIFTSIVKTRNYFQAVLRFKLNSSIMHFFIFTIFNHLNVHLQKNRNLETHHNWFSINCGRLLNEKVSGFRIQSPKLCRIVLENIAYAYICCIVKFHD